MFCAILSLMFDQKSQLTGFDRIAPFTCHLSIHIQKAAANSKRYMKAFIE